MKPTIGFANKFYTLWEVSEPFKKYTSPTSFYWEVKYVYYQNLSFDFGKAKSKVAARYGSSDYEVDFNLRGSKSFDKRISSTQNEASSTQFSFGNLEGQDICTCNDLWQLFRLYELQDSKDFLVKRRAFHARQRLIELGELVKYTWFEKQIGKEITNSQGFHLSYEYINVRRNYATKEKAILLEAEKRKAEMFDHYFNDGEKVALNLKFLKIFWFETIYGSSCIATYVDDQGRGFKYMGSSPNQALNEDEFIKIKATVCHDEYQGQKETKLKRISIIK